MAFKRFFITTLATAAVVVASCVALMIALDEFGIFREAKGRTIGIYTSERTAKYFLSMRYIPENFDAILIGPSLSDQLDTRTISAYKMYNLSLLGANAVELEMLMHNVLAKQAPKVLLICLDPFMVRNAEIYDARMTPRIRWTALGSTFMLDYYFKKIKKRISGKKDIFEYTEYGAATINEQPVNVVRTAIADYAAKVAQEHEPLKIDPVALEKLQQTIAAARSKGTRIYAFFYPHPEPVNQALQPRYARFRQQMERLFMPEDRLLDMTTAAYRAFRNDPANYVDGAHISRQGAAFLLKELDAMLTQGVGR